MSSVLNVTRMTLRGEGRRAAATYALPVTAFAAASALLLVTLGGYLAFSGRGDHPDAAFYQTLAAVASILIIVPCFTLGLAAARLGARRRDERLAALRLAGATPRQVVALSAVEAGVHGLLGAITGAALYTVVLPLVALLPFQGRPFTVSELWVGPLILLGVVLGTVTIAVVTALIGLRAVTISPLGVAAGHTRPAPRWIVVAVVGAALVVWSSINPAALGITSLLVALAVCFAVINLIGPFIVSLVGRVMLRRAADASALIAARRILDDPKGVWRSVGGVAVASFVAAGTSVLTALSAGQDDPSQAQMMSDLRLGAAFTLAVTFALAAISSVLTQVAAILENRRLYTNLALAGTPFVVMESARSQQVRTPVTVMSLVGAGMLLAFVFPLTGMVLLQAPQALVQLAVLLAAGICLVLVSVRASRPVLRAAMR